MGRTLTLEEAKVRTAYDVIREAAQGRGPLIVILEDGTSISIQEYPFLERSENEPPVLEPLPQLKGFIPAGWKEMVYGEDGAGRP